MSDDCCGHHLCVGPLPAAHLSRRQVLSPVRPRARRRGAGEPGEPGARPRRRPAAEPSRPTAACSAAGSTCRPRPSASSTCSWPAARRSSRPVRPQAAAQRAQRRGAPRLASARASGSPACRATRRRCRSPGRSSSSRSTASGGTWVSDLLPHTAKIVDDLCIVQSMYTEAINHDPAITFFQTGSQIAGRPSMGAWVQLRPRQRRTTTCRRSSS